MPEDGAFCNPSEIPCEWHKAQYTREARSRATCPRFVRPRIYFRVHRVQRLYDRRSTACPDKPKELHKFDPNKLAIALNPKSE